MAVGYVAPKVLLYVVCLRAPFWVPSFSFVVMDNSVIFSLITIIFAARCHLLQLKVV